MAVNRFALILCLPVAEHHVVNSTSPLCLSSLTADCIVFVCTAESSMSPVTCSHTCSRLQNAYLLKEKVLRDSEIK
jgi:hypothetical protein